MASPLALAPIQAQLDGYAESVALLSPWPHRGAEGDPEMHHLCSHHYGERREEIQRLQSEATTMGQMPICVYLCAAVDCDECLLEHIREEEAIERHVARQTGRAD